MAFGEVLLTSKVSPGRDRAGVWHQPAITLTGMSTKAVSSDIESLLPYACMM